MKNPAGLFISNKISLIFMGTSDWKNYVITVLKRCPLCYFSGVMSVCFTRV
jgi:hypothetical protein